MAACGNSSARCASTKRPSTARSSSRSLPPAIAALLCRAGARLLGPGLGYPPQIPWATIAQVTFYPCLAACFLMALQLLFSALWPNQAVAVTLGISGLLAAILPFAPDWLPWRHSALVVPQVGGPAQPQGSARPGDDRDHRRNAPPAGADRPERGPASAFWEASCTSPGAT